MGQNIAVIHHALNAGEVSPRYTGRQDQNKYLAACETLENFLPVVLGGAYVRPGTQFVAETKTVADHPEKRLIPFIASRTAAYVLEFGHEYIRFFWGDNTGMGAGTPGTPVFLSGTTPFEVVSPYDSADLAELFYVQSVDVMYLIHRFYPVHKLVRTDIDTWVLNEVNFNPPATIEDEPTGSDLGAGTLTLAALTGTGINFTAQNAVWLGSGTASGDVGRIIVSGAGRGIIKSVTSSTVVVVDIVDDFASSPIAADDWRLTLSPQGEIDISNDVSHAGQTLQATTTNPSFRAADVGKFIGFYGGSGKIYEFIDDSNVNVLLTADLKDVTVSDPDPTRAWTLEVVAWSEDLGYPSCGCFFEERLWLCKGLTINGSKTNDFESFAKGGDADDAIARTLSDDDVDVIVWIKGYKTLKVATGSGIFEISATSQNGALTPSSFKVAPIDESGAARIMPIRVGSNLIFVQDGQREILELSYNFSDDAFKSPKLFRLADHLNDGFFFSEIHRSRQPDSFIFAVRNDGVICACIYEPIDNVIGWARIPTDGEVKSLAVIPRGSTGKDWWWQCVERQNGVFVEFYEPNHARTGREWGDLHTDSAVLAQPDADGVVEGLDHLEGQTVWVIGDGCLYNAQRQSTGLVVSTAVVTGGEITLDPWDEDRPVAVAEVGLRYDAKVVPVEPVVPAELGGPFMCRYYANIGIRILRALGMRMRAYRVNINEPNHSTWIGERLVYRKPYYPMDQQVPMQRGKKCIINVGSDPFSRIEVIQDLPFPAEISNVVGNLHVGDRWCCDSYPDDEQFFTPIEPIPPEPADCPDTEPEEQELPIVCCYDSLNWEDLDGEIHHGQFSHATATGDFWHTTNLASGFGGGPWPESSPRVYYLLAPEDPDGPSCDLQDVDLPALPGFAANIQSPQTPQGGTCGKSDEKCFIVTLDNCSPNLVIGGRSSPFCRAFYGADSGWSFLVREGSFPFIGADIGHNAWCKHGNKFYALSSDDSGATWLLRRWPIPAPAGAFQDLDVAAASALSGWNNATFLKEYVLMIHASANWLYVLAQGPWGGGSSHVRVFRIDKTTLLYDSHWELTGLDIDAPWGFHVYSDDLIFLIEGNGSDSTIGFLRTSNGTVQIIGEFNHDGCTPAGNPVGPSGQHGFYYAAGYFYLSYAGFGLGATNVLKVGPLLCPSDPEVIWGT